MSSGQIEETCREWEPVVADKCGKRADFILWGKLFEPEALGPRCYDHAARHIGWAGMSQLDQWAVYDLRTVRAALSSPAGAVANPVPQADAGAADPPSAASASRECMIDSPHGPHQWWLAHTGGDRVQLFRCPGVQS